MWNGISSRPPGPEDFLQFNQELLGIVRSGIPLDEGLEMVAKEMGSGRLRTAVQHAHGRIRQGASLSEAVAEQSAAFPESYRNLIAVGERMGSLGEVLEYLINHYRRQVRFQRTVQSVATYPLTVLTVALTIICGVLVFVVPKMVDIYDQLGAELPLLTRWFMSVGGFLHKYWPGVAVVGAGVLFYMFLAVSDVTRRDWGFLRFLPIFSRLYRYQVCASFLSTAGMLLQRGVPALEALGLARTALISRDARREVEVAAQRLEQGAPLGELLAQLAFLPNVTAAMLRSSAQRADLPDTMASLADYFDLKVKHTQANLTGLLEPLMIIVIGSFVALLVISMYLPLVWLPTHIR